LVPFGFAPVFLVVYFALYPIFGTIAIILSFVPVAAVSWTMGLRAGVFAGFAAVMVNALLLSLVGEGYGTVFGRGILSSLSLIVLGGLAGWVSELVEKLDANARELAAEQRALRNEMAMRARKEQELQAALAEKEVLLKEIHHRVKNNLQIISSLLSLQSGRVNDPAMQSLYEDSQNRVRSMALIHERLYRSDDLGRIDFGAYLDDLTRYLLNSYPANRIAIVVESEDIALDIDTAIPCGLIVNELVSNALKHAFPNERSGEIVIRMLRSGFKLLRLEVCDSGVGVPAQIDLQHSTTLGLRLVNSLVRQLNGTIEVSSTNGMGFKIQFPEYQV